jgi:uncharacterized membrane protein required for colicin V production
MVVADIVLGAFIAVCAAMGYLSGLAWQVIRVVCLVLAIWLSMLYSAPLADIVRGDADSLSPMVEFVICPVGIFITLLLVLYLVCHLLRDLIDELKPRRFDRWSGALIGCVKGMLLAGVCVALLMFSSVGERSEGLRGALAGSVVAKASAYAAYAVESALAPLLPEGLGMHLPDSDGFDWPDAD